MSFDIKNYVLQGMQDYSFDEKAIRNPWEHLAKVYGTYFMCKPTDVTNDQVK